ncbi:MAG: puuR [Pseudonocardiales bacterium]|nr:puuR [Pseudonocardiales bacterium]
MRQSGEGLVKFELRAANSPASVNFVPESPVNGIPDALEAFGPKVRLVRESQGMSLRAFAAELGVSPSAVSQIESGKIRPTMKRLHDIVRILDIGLEEVFAGSAPPREPEPVAPPAIDKHEHPSDERPFDSMPFPDVDVIPFAAESDHPRLQLEDGIEWFNIAPIRLPQLEVIKTVYPPGARVSERTEFVQHTGWEMGYVISGQMRVQVAFVSQDVGPGESICFDSSIPHKLFNPFTEPVTAVWIRSTRPIQG